MLRILKILPPQTRIVPSSVVKFVKNAVLVLPLITSENVLFSIHNASNMTKSLEIVKFVILGILWIQLLPALNPPFKMLETLFVLSGIKIFV